jgi:hypothetical protein
MALLPIMMAVLLLLVGMLLASAIVVVVSRVVRGARRYPEGPAVTTHWSSRRTLATSTRPGWDSWRRRPEDGTAERGPVAIAAWRQARAAAWRWAGVLTGAVVAYLSATRAGLGSGMLVAASLFGLCVVAGTLMGEIIGPVPGGPVRRANLRIRRIRDYAPRLLGTVVVAATVVLVALGSVTTVVASPDDLGRAGRWLVCTVPKTFDGAEGGAGYGPFPGSFYTLPGLAVVVAGLVLAGLTLRRIVRRPQPADIAVTDDALRRRSTELTLSATGILVLVPLAGIALTAGGALTAVAGQCGHAWWTGAGWGLIALAAAAAVLAVWCGSLLLIGRPRLGAER